MFTVGAAARGRRRGRRGLRPDVGEDAQWDLGPLEEPAHLGQVESGHQLGPG